MGGVTRIQGGRGYEVGGYEGCEVRGVMRVTRWEGL